MLRSGPVSAQQAAAPSSTVLVSSAAVRQSDHMNLEAYDTRARVATLIGRLKREPFWPSTSMPPQGTYASTRDACPPSIPAQAETPLSARRREPPVLEEQSEVQQLRERLRIAVAQCNGATEEEIALAQGMQVQTVRARMQDAGVQITKTRTAFATADIDEIRRLHRSGQSARHLARRYRAAHTVILRDVH